MRRAVLCALLALALPLALSGCGRTLEERVADRDACEAVGGTYVEWTGEFAGSRYNRCDLERKGGTPS